MGVCKATGLVKYGTMESARDLLKTAGLQDSRKLKIERCLLCNCLHVVEKKPEEVKPPKRVEPTRGVSGWVHLDAEEITAETEKAFLVKLEGRDDGVWIPKSQVSEPENLAAKDRNVTVSITEWLAKEKGLEA